MAFPLLWAVGAGLAAVTGAALTLSNKNNKTDSNKKDGGTRRAQPTKYNQQHVDEAFESYEATGFNTDIEEMEEELRSFNVRLKEQQTISQPVVMNKETIKSYVELDKEKARRLKEILSDIREVAGYSVDELSARIDVTRQTMYNWERKADSKISVPHYYALMTILAFQKKPDLRVSHKNILKVLDILVEKTENYSEEYVLETRKQLRNLANELRNPSTRDDFLKQEDDALRKSKDV